MSSRGTINTPEQCSVAVLGESYYRFSYVRHKPCNRTSSVPSLVEIMNKNSTVYKPPDCIKVCFAREVFQIDINSFGRSASMMVP